MCDVLPGSPWLTLRPFLSLDVFMRLRTTARYWNQGESYGPYDDSFRFILLSNEGHETLSLSQHQGTLSPDWGHIWGYAPPVVYDWKICGLTWANRGDMRFQWCGLTPLRILGKAINVVKKKGMCLSTCEDNSTVSCGLTVVLVYLFLCTFSIAILVVDCCACCSCLQNILPYSSMSIVRLTGNGKPSPSWYHSYWRVKNDDYKKSDWDWEWGESQPSQPRTDGAVTHHPSDDARDPEKSHSGAKKIKTRDEHLKVSSDDLWKVRAKLNGKKGSLSKTKKSNREMNDKVCELNQKLSKHLETLALLYQKCEQACREKKVADEQFNKDFYCLLERAFVGKARCLETSVAYEKTEEALNEGLGLVSCQFQEVSTAVLALTQGNQARGTNEQAYLLEALTVLDALLLSITQEVVRVADGCRH